MQAPAAAPIKDDVSVINGAIKKTRDAFNTGKTKPLSFRIA
jgi:hypothetical protein